MEYTIINKIEYINELIYTPVGYVLDNQQLVDDINNSYQIFENWIDLNKSNLEIGSVNLGDFFENTIHVYSAYQQTDNIEGMGLNEIININEL